MSFCIELDGVHKSYETPAGRFEALKPLDLRVDEGEHVALVGPSGSGKSTLLHLISGIDVPTAGSVRLLGEELGAMDETRRARFRGLHVGIVFQFFQLLPTLTVEENVVLAMDLVGRIPRARRRERAAELLDRMGVLAHAGKFPAELSGGEQQRVAIARALANDPPILVADEPTGNLDSDNSERIHTLFGRCSAEGRTVLVATHEREGLDRYDRVLGLRDGVLKEVRGDRREPGAHRVVGGGVGLEARGA